MLRVASGVLGLLLFTSCSARGNTGYVGRPTRLSTALEQAVVGSALQGLEWHLNMPAPYCLVFHGPNGRAEPDFEWLGRLILKHQVLPQRACPPTYGSMVRAVDSLGRDVGPARPVGYVDPYHVEITPPVAITRELTVVRFEATQGTRGWLLYCEVVLAAPHTATCGPTSQWVS
jgi:hypothetical protein